MEKCLLTVVQRHPSKAVQVSNDIFALPSLMLFHGGTKGGGGVGVRRGGDVLCCMANAKFPELWCARH